MKIDIRGRVDNLKLAATQGLRPVFEAIANSIHAIEDRAEAAGRITITVRRKSAQGVLRSDAKRTDPISDFEIQDNGIGFNDQNYESFNTSDSRYKSGRGGKGIGRLLWLKAFTKASVDSVYAKGERKERRRFDFTYSESGVEKEQVETVGETPISTTVKLTGFKSEYQAKCPKSLDTIAQRIIEHCLEYLALDACPKMMLIDGATGDEVDLNAMFAENLRTQREDFEVGGHSFQIMHVMTPPRPNEKHSVYFCAHSRAVTSLPLAGIVPNLEASLTDPERDKPFVYAGYVSSSALDDRVVAERTEFEFPDDDTLTADDELRWSTVSDASVEKAAGYLSEFTEAIKAKKEERIRRFVEHDAPQYRPLLKHKPESIDKIPASLPAERLDVELYRLNQEYDLELQDRYREILGDRHELEDFEAFSQHYDDFLTEWNERGLSSLAKYVAHRKATLDFLRHRLGVKDDGKYHLEEAIHEVVFPLRATSDDVPPERLNLWILDETLAYHHYLASDLPMKKADPIECGSKKEPDLLIFNNTFAFSEEDAPRYGSVVIVEFKRPLRDDYDDDKNPIEQVLEYVDLLRAGRAKDRRGRLIRFPESMPIHALIVCDFTERLKKQAKIRDFRPTADDERFYLFHTEYGAFIEILSFDAMMDLAERRNRILFDKLGLKTDPMVPAETSGTPDVSDNGTG